MRIKKKDVILEAKLIDTTNEFNPQEKRMLKTLNKKYGKGGMYGDYDRFVGAAFLIEELGLPYDQAYDLSLTFWWHGDKLFKESDPIYKKENKGFIFHKIMRNLLISYIKKLGGDSLGVLDITWEDPHHLISEKDAFVISQEIILWDGYMGFTLYITFNNQFVEDKYVDYEIKNHNTLMLYIQFNEYKEEDPKTNTHVDVTVEWSVSESFTTGDLRNSLMQFDVPIPIPMTKESIYEIFALIIKDVLEKIESTTFILQPYVAPPSEPEEENDD